VILLVVGLACASWMTMAPEKQKPSDESPAPAKVAADTTKPGEKSYSRRQIIRFDDQGNPHKQVIERYETEDGHHEITLHEDFDVDMAELDGFDMPIAIQAPAFDFHVLAVPPVPDMEFEPLEPIEFAFAPMPPLMSWSSDTLKPGEYTFHYQGMDHKDWESFSNEFQTRFKEQFADFYKEHSKEMESMMKEMAEEYERNAKEYKMDVDFSAIKRYADELAEHQAEWARENAKRQHELAEQQAQWSIEYTNRDREAKARTLNKAKRDKDLADQEYEIHERVREQVAENEEQVNAMKESMAKFGEAVKAELVKDGYFKKDEDIKSMNWDSAGDITINGKKIKDRDKAKYNGIHDKFFKKGGMLRIEE